MSEEKNDEPIIWRCQLGCPCFFFSYADLQKHYEAFKTTGVNPNRYDHTVRWRNELEKRKHEYAHEENL